MRRKDGLWRFNKDKVKVYRMVKGLLHDKPKLLWFGLIGQPFCFRLEGYQKGNGYSNENEITKGLSISL